MDSTELHYLTYDPEVMMQEMLAAYMEQGGDVLFPGDEKSMLLSAVQAIMVQAFAGVDHALRMGTLRYAVGDYLDLIGQTRGCSRIAAAKAVAEVTITATEDGVAITIPKGAAMTEDGVTLYVLDAAVELTGGGESVTANVTCASAGTVGNALKEDAVLQLINYGSGIASVVCSEDASGGIEKETDSVYRARIRTHGASIVTSGPAMQYEAVAGDVSGEILDVKAISGGAGAVKVYLILADGANATEVIGEVRDALNAEGVRPLTDSVSVLQATEVAYTINVRYTAEVGKDISAMVSAAIEEYKAWQDETIGQAFNPDRLMAMLYQAGCTRVTWGTGSVFNGGTVAYSEIAAYARCKGTITAARV